MKTSYPKRTSLLLAAILAQTVGTLSSAAQPAGPAPSPTYANVAYGEHPNQVIDFYQADGEEPMPLVIYIHGGGFRNGTHDKVSARVIRHLLEAGIHYASVEYRFIPEARFPAPHEDAVRAVQFIRSKAEEWGIDKARIAGHGGSAGAQLVAYLAWSDDFADPESEDPVARESSRLTAVVLNGCQSTLDLDWWVENIPGYKRAYHSLEDGQAGLSAVEVRALIHELSVIHHISAEDPPSLLQYAMKPDDPIPGDPAKARGWSIHHVQFGIVMEEKLRQAGVEAYLQYPGVHLPFDNSVAFLIHQLK